ncbi:MAG: hypothetical protein H6831_09465 [Planctomycetes bacterium]|nr:hypothetical protein [Planctomycetota bacterium]MCB9904622.1 hypothetical protein [Planctomycetota bacterium]
MNRLALAALLPLALAGAACSRSEHYAPAAGANAQDSANAVSLRVTGMT